MSAAAIAPGQDPSRTREMRRFLDDFFARLYSHLRSLFPFRGGCRALPSPAKQAIWRYQTDLLSGSVMDRFTNSSSYGNVQQRRML